MVMAVVMEQENHRDQLNRMQAQLVEAQPWISLAREALEAKDWYPPPNEKVVIGSDYSGQHQLSRYVTYAFVVSNELNWEWDRVRWHFRQHNIPDNRRLSFKSFGKTHNPLALAYFLDITKLMNGRLVVFAFEKGLLLQLPPIRPANDAFKLDARWKPLGLEEATRKALLVALLAAQYVPPDYSMDWITDEDPSLGNELMFSDVQRMAATLSGVFSPVQRRFFGMGTTGEDCEHMYREDFVAIADFAAGMVAEISTHLADRPFTAPLARPTKHANFEKLSEKTQLIAEWFWHADSNFRKTCFLVQGTKELPEFMELYV